MMINVLAVGVGGFLGAVLRYALAQLSKIIVPDWAFPIGTFLANILGAFFIGVAFQFFTKQQSMGSISQLFIMVGIMGGFTTFSSFSLETVNLICEGRFWMAGFYAVGSVLICLVGVWLGKTVI